MLIPAWYFFCCMYDNLLNYALSESLGLPNCHRSERNIEIENGIRNYVLKDKRQESGFKSENNLHPIVETVYKVEKSVQEKLADEVESVDPSWGPEDRASPGPHASDAAGARWEAPGAAAVGESGLSSPRTLCRRPVPGRLCRELSV